MKERLNIYPVRNGILNDAIDRIVVKLHGQKKKYGAKSFLFTGAGANGGTTTVAINTAIALAEAGWKTVFVDCDLRKDQQFKRITTAEVTTLSGYISGKVSGSGSIVNKTDVENLDYIIAGDKCENPVRLLSNYKMETLMVELGEKYDFIIIDTPSVGVCNDAELLIPFVNAYMFVVRMNETKRRQLVDARIALADYEDKFIGIIANRLELFQYKGMIRDFDYFSNGSLAKKRKMAMIKKGGQKK